MSSNQQEEVIFNVCRNVSFYEVSRPDGRIVGGVYAIPFVVDNSSEQFPGEEFIEVCVLSINAEFRRRGYGTKLMQSLLEDFAGWYVCLMVEINPDPEGMSKDDLVNWYKRLGFAEGSPFHEGEGIWMSQPPRLEKIQESV